MADGYSEESKAALLEQKNKASETLRPNGQELASGHQCVGQECVGLFWYFLWVQLGDDGTGNWVENT